MTQDILKDVYWKETRYLERDKVFGKRQGIWKDTLCMLGSNTIYKRHTEYNRPQVRKDTE